MTRWCSVSAIFDTYHNSQLLLVSPADAWWQRVKVIGNWYFATVQAEAPSYQGDLLMNALLRLHEIINQTQALQFPHDAALSRQYLLSSMHDLQVCLAELLAGNVPRSVAYFRAAQIELEFSQQALQQSIG